MFGHLSYSKKNSACALIESEGWTRDVPDTYDARFINSDDVLSVSDVTVLHGAYGGKAGMDNVCAKR